MYTDFLSEAEARVRAEAETKFTLVPKPETPPEFRPLGSYILVWMDQDTSDKTEGGLYKPAVATKERPDSGEVVLVGPDVTSLHPGDRIAFVKYAGKKITVNGDDYTIMQEREVYGVYGRSAFGFGD